MRIIRPLALAAFLLLGACVPKPAPPPAPAPAPARPPQATPGEGATATWRYRRDGMASEAAFGTGALADLLIRCDPAARTVTLSRLGAGTGPLTIATSYAAASAPSGVMAGRTTAVLAATDPTLDRIAFSRGRFTIKVAGLPDLAAPAWAEPARVIEDCRSPAK